MYRWLWSYVKPFRFLLLLALLLTFIASALNLVAPVLSGDLVDKVILHGNSGLLLPLLGFMVGATLLRVITRYTFLMIYENVSQTVIAKIRNNLFTQLHSLDFGFFDKNKTGDLMVAMTSDIDAVRHFLAWVIYQSLENSLIFLISIIVLFHVNFYFALILLVVTPFIAYFAVRLSRKVKPTFSSIRAQFSKLNSVVQENISGNRVVKAFAREDYEIEKFDQENDEYTKRNVDSAKIWGKYIPLIEFFSGLLMVIMLLMGGLLIIYGHLTLGAFVIFTGLIWAITNPLRMSGWIINDIQRFRASLERLHNLSLSKSALSLPDQPVKPKTFEGLVEFKDVSFDFDGIPILTHLNFTAKPGQTIGILGPTGSGKSTLARLLGRFYDATEGTILLDGQDIKTLDLEFLRQQVGLTMQDVFLFSDTIQANIAFAKPDASDQEIFYAAELSQAKDFITKLDEGFETIVGERGVGLSGGQKQRIALARLFLANPTVLVFDDTTSAVDVETETKIQQSIKSIKGKKTVFLIAHRISSLQHADLILVLQDGKITERGTHDELIAQKGYYHEVYSHQTGRL